MLLLRLFQNEKDPVTKDVLFKKFERLQLEAESITKESLQFVSQKTFEAQLKGVRSPGLLRVSRKS